LGPVLNEWIETPCEELGLDPADRITTPAEDWRD
jgi:hypothetical protein